MLERNNLLGAPDFSHGGEHGYFDVEKRQFLGGDRHEARVLEGGGLRVGDDGLGQRQMRRRGSDAAAKPSILVEGDKYGCILKEFRRVTQFRLGFLVFEGVGDALSRQCQQLPDEPSDFHQKTNCLSRHRCVFYNHVTFEEAM